MKYTVLTSVNDGTPHQTGEVIIIEDKKEAKRLLALGAITHHIEIPVEEDDNIASAVEELIQLDNLDADQAHSLATSGFDSVLKLQNATVDAITVLKIKGLGKANAEKLIAEANNVELEG